MAGSMWTSSHAGGLYSWTDADGNVHYGDQVPPSDSQSGHAVMDRQGQIVDRVAPRKSASQLERERIERERLAEQRRLKREQEIRDTTLISTFSSVEEMDRIRDQRVSTLDSLIALGRKKVGKLSEKLDAAENRKTILESKGRAVPKQLSENIQVLNQQMTYQENKISEYHKKKEEMLESFRRDRARFVELNKR